MTWPQLLLMLREHWPVAGGFVLYCIEAWLCMSSKNMPGAVMFVGYAIGNIGIIWALSVVDRAVK